MSNTAATHMRRTFELAARGLFSADPNPRVGCVLVKNEEVVGEGWHVRPGQGHAEVNALRAAGERARGATAFVSLEPCCHHGRTGPCTKALIEAGVRRVVAAMRDPNPRVAGQGLDELERAGLEVQHGLLEQEALDINPGYVARMSRARPFVRCKLAMSLDGRTAMASGESRWITSPAARADVQRLRARSSAIVTGSGTVLADDPAMTVRIPEAGGRQPLRIVLDSSHRVSPAARLFATVTPVLLVGARAAAPAYLDSLPSNAEVLDLPDGDGVDLAALSSELVRREVNEVHLECGARLAGAFLQAGLIDEMVIYVAPVLMGDAARGLFHLPGLDAMSQRLPLDLVESAPLGPDWKFTLRPGGSRPPAPS